MVVRSGKVGSGEGWMRSIFLLIVTMSFGSSSTGSAIPMVIASRRWGG